MECPLCNAKNDSNAKECRVCGAKLGKAAYTIQKNTAVSIESVDLTKRSKKPLLYIFTAIALALIPWLFMLDLLSTPTPTKNTRLAFSQAISSYQKDKERWDGQKDDILKQMREQRLNKEMGKSHLRFQDLPLDILVSFLINDLGFTKGELKHSTLHIDSSDSEQQSFILSKYEDSLLNIILSLTIRLDSQGDKLKVEFDKLQRGKREIPQELAWDYFLPELQALRRLESYFGGVNTFKVSQIKSEGPGQNRQYQVTWNYSHPNFFPERLPVN